MPREIFTVTDQMREDLRAAAKSRGMTVSTYIRRQLADILAKEFKRPLSEYEVEIGGDRSEADQSG